MSACIVGDGTPNGNGYRTRRINGKKVYLHRLAWEQVPTVLPVWEACAEVLRGHGWNVVTGNVQAEQYGVPQTRKRAVLLAHRDREVSLPTPTHSKYHSRSPERLDDGVLPWVSMAQALGWGATARPSMTVTGGGTETGGAETFGNAARRGLERERDAGRWQLRSNNCPNAAVRQSGRAGAASDRPVDAPAPTVTGKGTMTGHREAFTDEGQEQTYVAEVADDKPWTRERPATTIATRDLVPDPGANANRFNGATKSRNDGVRVTVEQAAMLQTFPADYPWQGSKTKQFQQIGNAIPPMLAAALLREVAP